MFRFFAKKRIRMSPEQAKAEQEAIRLLTQAQHLLKVDPNNADEAKRLRFEVTEKLLPPRKMYIIGKHPRSLLLDVDRKIQHAYMQQIQQSGQIYQEEAPAIVLSDTQRACERWINRYGSLKWNVQRQLYWSIGCLIALAIMVIFLLYTMGRFDNVGSFSNSFKWVER